MTSLLDIDPSLQASEPPQLTGCSSISSSPPFPTWQKRRLVEDVETEVLIQSFDDRILVIITQNDKMGSLVRGGPSDSSPTFLQLKRGFRPFT